MAKVYRDSEKYTSIHLLLQIHEDILNLQYNSTWSHLLRRLQYLDLPELYIYDDRNRQSQQN